MRPISWPIMIVVVLTRLSVAQITDVEKATEQAFSLSFLQSVEPLPAGPATSDCFIGLKLYKCRVTPENVVFLVTPISAEPIRSVSALRLKGRTTRFLPSSEQRWAPAKVVKDGIQALTRLTWLANRPRAIDCNPDKDICNIVIRSRPRDDRGVVLLRCNIAAVGQSLSFPRYCHPAAITIKNEWWIPVLSKFEVPKRAPDDDIIGMTFGTVYLPTRFADPSKVLRAVDRALKLPQFSFSLRTVRHQLFLAMNEGHYSTLIPGGWYVLPEVHVYVLSDQVDVDCSIRVSKYRRNSPYSWHMPAPEQESLYCGAVTTALLNEVKAVCSGMKAEILGTNQVICH